MIYPFCAHVVHFEEFSCQPHRSISFDFPITLKSQSLLRSLHGIAPQLQALGKGPLHQGNLAIQLQLCDIAWPQWSEVLVEKPAKLPTSSVKLKSFCNDNCWGEGFVSVQKLKIHETCTRDVTVDCQCEWDHVWIWLPATRGWRLTAGIEGQPEMDRKLNPDGSNRCHKTSSWWFQPIW